MKLVKEYNIDLEQGVADALRSATVHLRKNRIEAEDGTKIEACKLTALSIAIGKLALIKADQREKALYHGPCIDIGDFILEGLYENEWIDITRNDETLKDIQFTGGRSPWLVSRGKNWDRIYDLDDKYISMVAGSNITSNKIKDIDGLFQDNGKSVIKNWTLEDEERFKDYLEEPFVEAINILQQTPWKVDKDILKVVQDNPQAFYTEEYIEDEKLRKSNDSKKDSYKLSVKHAKEWVGTEFYYYVDADYRGRLYYQFPYLNYQGKDLERGLLKFANEQELTEESLYYLKIHTASSYNQSYKKDEIPDWCTSDYVSYLHDEGLESISVDKMTLQDRAKWVDIHLDLISSTWFNRILHDCEKPVVFLACCKEIVEIMEGKTVTQLPIAIDGSNNGWQHLAAISKDEKAGELVGLVPIEIQKDFYVQTAKKLFELMEDDRLKEILFTMPMKHIRKGISKRGSMTRAYSAGKLAIAKNMYADCHQEGFNKKYGITLEDCMSFAGVLIKAIDAVCPGPLSTMSFMQKLAGHIIKENDYVEWTTPSGFPVKYEKYVERDMKWKSWVSKRRIEHVYKQPKYRKDKETGEMKLIPSPGGFAAGISPNFIHSMDAAHMALVIQYWGKDFAAIHDSFSCHAAGVDELLALTKEVFIAMYDHEDMYTVIKEMLLFDAEEFDSSQFMIGDLDIKGIHDSDYFFA